MRQGFVLFSAAIVSAIAAVLILPIESPEAASGEALIKARVDFMKNDIGKNWDVLANFAKKGKGSLADVEKSANALTAAAKKIPGLFPKGTARGDYPAKLTRALPEIWMDWDGFKKSAEMLSNGSAKLATLAKAGDKDAVVAMIGKAGKYSKTKIGCSECHKDFRGARVK